MGAPVRTYIRIYTTIIKNVLDTYGPQIFLRLAAAAVPNYFDVGCI